MSPTHAIVAAWLIWMITWIMAAGWSARLAAHHDLGAESPSRVLTLAALVMIVASYYPVPSAVLWVLPAPGAWAMLGVVLAGLLATWVARLHLGPLWSPTSSPTPEHRVVETGPYALVRHPVYAGLLLAAIATAAERGRVEAVAGVLTLIAGIALRARLEERLLRRDLGDEAYEAYRRRVPMLIPFAK